MQKFRKVNNTCQKNTEQLAIHCPTIHSPIYAFFTFKKAFTHSRNGYFWLIISCFECEGLAFQPFTAWGAWMLLYSWFSTFLLCEGLRNQPFTVILRPVWTLGKASLHTQKHWKSEENIQRVKGWMLFSGNQIRIHARARRGKSMPWAWLGMLPAQVAD